MATTTAFNTRIRLRYDTYQNWVTNNPALLEGEVAICSVPSAYSHNASDVSAAVQNPPKILMKVGPGNFNDLNWLSAVAADVHTWAKMSQTDFVGWLEGTKTIEGLGRPALATSSELSALSSTVSGQGTRLTTAEGKITTLEGKVSTAEGKITTLEGEMDSAEGRLTALETATGANGLTKRVEALEAKDIELNSAIGANATDIAANTSAIEILNGGAGVEGSVAHSVAAEATRATGVEAELEKAINDEVEARKGAIAQEVTDRNAAIESVRSGLQTKIDEAKGTADAADTLSKANKTLIETLQGSDTNLSARQIAADEINILIKGADPEGGKTIENITNLVAYVDENAGEIAELITEVDDHGTRLGTAESDIAGLETTVGEHTTSINAINTKIGTVQEGKTLVQLITENGTADQAYADTVAGKAYTDAKDYVDEKVQEINSENSSLAGRVTAVEQVAANNTTAISNEVTRAQGAEKTLTDNLAAEVTRAQGAEGTLTTNLAAEVERAQGAESGLGTRIDNLQEIALTADISNGTISQNGTELNLIFKCGDSSTNLWTE